MSLNDRPAHTHIQRHRCTRALKRAVLWPVNHLSWTTTKHPLTKSVHLTTTKPKVGSLNSSFNRENYSSREPRYRAHVRHCLADHWSLPLPSRLSCEFCGKSLVWLCVIRTIWISTANIHTTGPCLCVCVAFRPSTPLPTRRYHAKFRRSTTVRDCQHAWRICENT